MSKSELRGTVEKTQWCINKKSNMYAMPVWGHTVKHYCRIRVHFYQTAPGFKNIPQHLNDHHRYNEEVAGMIGKATDDWEPHEVTAIDISGLLDTISTRMQGKLAARGSGRTGGTHNAWLNAVRESEQGRELVGWYLPFSMADDSKVTKRAFPIKGDSAGIRAWIAQIASALRL